MMRGKVRASSSEAVGPTGRAIAATLIAGTLVVGALFVGQVVFASNGPAGVVGTKLVAQEQPAGPQAATTDRPRPFAGAYHAEATWLMADGSTKSTVTDRGRITEVGDSTLTIEQPNGSSVKASVTAEACLRKNGRPAQLSDLEVGEGARLVQAGGSAVAVRSGRRQAGEKGKGCHLLRGVVHGDITASYRDGSSRAFAYDRGMITSIGAGTIELVRRDGKTVELSYDDKTFVIDDGQPGSVEGLKVGDVAMFFSQDGHADLIRCIGSPGGET